MTECVSHFTFNGRSSDINDLYSAYDAINDLAQKAVIYDMQNKGKPFNGPLVEEITKVGEYGAKAVLTEGNSVVVHFVFGSESWRSRNGDWTKEYYHKMMAFSYDDIVNGKHIRSYQVDTPEKLKDALDELFSMVFPGINDS